MGNRQPRGAGELGGSGRSGRAPLGFAAGAPHRDRSRSTAMRSALAALGALLATLAIAGSAGAATRQQEQQGAFAVPTPTAPVRDVVIEHPTRALARATASANFARYSVNDGQGGSVEITVSTLCSIGCTGQHDPQTIANFLGTLPHGSEINLLSVMVVTPGEIAGQCGSTEAQACYFPSENQMLINGSATTSPPPDNATPNFVIAHEYGHHVANHRNNSPFANPAIDWGPKNWASWAGVCRGVRTGRYFPGDEGSHYRDNPGEAFAESYAHNRFPTDPVPWEWPNFPDPQTGAFPAIQRDAVSPWNGDHADRRNGRFGRRRRVHKQTKGFATPLDGDLTVTLKGPDRANMALKLKGPDGSVVARSDGPGSHEQVHFTVCGERSFTTVIRRHGHRRARYTVTALEP
jgi:hypothetical protein